MTKYRPKGTSNDGYGKDERYEPTSNVGTIEQRGEIIEEKGLGESRELGIDVPLVTRVEGHSRIVVKMHGKEVVEAQMQVIEGMRLFEAWMRGRNYMELHHFASRVCGMCSASHQLASIHAIESGCGITPSAQTEKLRELMCYGELLQETALHMYLLALPDFLGFDSIISMADKHPEEVRDALRVKSVGNDICRMLGGRAVHQWAMHPGGFSKIPDRYEVVEILGKLREIIPPAWKMVERFSKLKFPDYRRKSQYIALTKKDSYAFENGQLSSSDGWTRAVSGFEDVISEEVVHYSTAKRARIGGNSYQVGPLARMNLSSSKLGDLGKKALGMMNVKFPSDNPFHNNAARAVELMEIIDKSIGILENDSFKIEDFRSKPKAGKGYGATEAPRGTLFYHFDFDDTGKATFANIITPTAQNQIRMEEDMRGFLPLIADKPNTELAHLLQMLIRSFDPCNSCATHFMQI